MGLIGVIIGAVLSGIGFYLKERTERRRTIALALADLLEVRHHLAGIDVVFTELKKRFDIPPEVALIFQTLVDQMLPINADVHKRYDNAITLLAGIDPLLAIQLRSKNTLPEVLGLLRGLGNSAGIAKDEIVAFENTLRNNLVPSLDEAVLELACRYSFFTKIKVKQLIAKSKDLPPELNFVFDQIGKMELKGQQKPT